MKSSTDLSVAEYRALAEVRFRIRRFLHFSETAARNAGLEPQQHQLLLAIKGLPEQQLPIISTIAERLQLANNSTQELVRRTEQRGLIETRRGPDDRRQVVVRLTSAGEAALRDLSMTHVAELRSQAAELTRSLEQLVS